MTTRVPDQILQIWSQPQMPTNTRLMAQELIERRKAEADDNARFAFPDKISNEPSLERRVADLESQVSGILAREVPE